MLAYLSCVQQQLKKSVSGSEKIQTSTFSFQFAQPDTTEVKEHAHCVQETQSRWHPETVSTVMMMILVMVLLLYLILNTLLVVSVPTCLKIISHFKKVSQITVYLKKESQ